VTIWLNGHASDVTEGTTLADAIDAMIAPLDGRGVAAAVDGEVVPKAQWKDTTLADGQHIEVVQAVQGG
jgi:sulfur carrier protein